MRSRCWRGAGDTRRRGTRRPRATNRDDDDADLLGEDESKELEVRQMRTAETVDPSDLEGLEALLTNKFEAKTVKRLKVSADANDIWVSASAHNASPPARSAAAVAASTAES
ncbi:unnamed protein product [Prorocentrum cordatum]|uniref:Uncharacterized protein n=1 Tax=Prorocentrum cordatum TaxID=2364126 RepID=A0ABN9UT65_9DINO|nr:unnamed protein product [Polarella glacialis]